MTKKHEGRRCKMCTDARKYFLTKKKFQIFSFFSKKIFLKFFMRVYDVLNFNRIHAYILYTIVSR